MIHRSLRAIAASLVVLVAVTPAASAAETIGTLSLDALSFISLDDQQILAIPSGSSIRFRFGTPSADGTIPFTIQPGDVAIEPIPLGDGQTLTYGLASSTAGVVTPVAGGRRLEFIAQVVATTQDESGARPLTYAMPFSTESVEASNLAQTHSIEITGMRLVENTWFVQIVGAVTNDAEASHLPGAAVYTVLSGQFDQMP